MQFDAKKEADTLENLAKERIDTGKSDDHAANNKLANEWLSLNPEQRAQVGKELVSKYDNSDWNSLPRPHMQYDAKGECIGIDFTASALDFGADLGNTRVVALHPSTGGEIVEVDHTTGKHRKLDGIACDSASTMVNTPPDVLKAAGGLEYSLEMTLDKKGNTVETPVPAGGDGGR